MWFGISLGVTVLGVFIVSPMNAYASNRILRMTVNYRVKVPLIARTKTANTLTIPLGALLEWLPPDPGAPPDGLTSVQWQQEDYLVNGAELYQNCERV